MDATALNDVLNRPKTRLGLDYRVLGVCMLASICTALFVKFLLGVALLFGLPMAARRALRKDPQMYRLWVLSFHWRAYYDPEKVRR